MQEREYETQSLGNRSSYRATLGALNHAERTRKSSLLEEIEHRIMQAACAAQEIGHKLNQHADQVHGPVPTEGERASNDRDLPEARLDRIFIALDVLDGAQSYMAQAAGRNTTLA